MTECEAAWLLTLLDCMHGDDEESIGIVPKEMPFFQIRPFGDSTSETYGLYNEGGGNTVTYLAGLIQRYLPGITHSLYFSIAMAYDFAKWYDINTIHERYQDIYHDEIMKTNKQQQQQTTTGVGTTSGLPHPMKLGLRTAEYLDYQTTGRLGQHADAGSIMTISIAMSEPNDYEGGYFQLLSSSVLFKVPRLSAIVFYSEASHGITPIVSGQRQVFVTELWPLRHVRMGDPRPDVKEFRQRQYDMYATKSDDDYVEEDYYDDEEEYYDDYYDDDEEYYDYDDEEYYGYEDDEQYYYDDDDHEVPVDATMPRQTMEEEESMTAGPTAAQGEL